MFTEKFREVLSKEGPASIVTWTKEDAHVSATWNSYINTTEEGKLLIPAAWMNQTESNIAVNNKIKMIFGSKEVMGKNSMGAGFLLEGTARFLETGKEVDMMKVKFPWLTRVLEITPTNIKQTL